MFSYNFALCYNRLKRFAKFLFKAKRMREKRGDGVISIKDLGVIEMCIQEYIRGLRKDMVNDAELFDSTHSALEEIMKYREYHRYLSIVSD